MRRSEKPSTVRLVSLALTIVGIGALTACTGGADPVETTPSVTAAPSPSASPTPTAPALVPEGTAADNLPYFESVMWGVWGTDRQVEGAAYIDALTTAGFDRTAMAVTPDRTSVDNPADAIQFSVLWAGECLVGQVGPSTPEPTAVVAPQLPDGGCLIGETRAIDW